VASDVSNHYRGARGEAYFAQQNLSGDLGGKLKARLFPLVKKSDAVLDFGCGGGWLLKNLEAQTRIGVDPNAAAREQCLRNGIEAYASISDVPSEYVFDCALSNHALEHVADPIAALKALRSRLKPGGRVYIVVPIDDWRVQRRVDLRNRDRHLHTWTPLLLGNTLDEAGFEDISVEVMTTAWPPRFEFFHRVLPSPLFDALCWVSSAVLKRRQLRAMAANPPTG